MFNKILFEVIYVHYFQVILGEYDQLSTGYYPPDSYHAIDVIRHPLYRNAMRFRENGMIIQFPELKFFKK